MKMRLSIAAILVLAGSAAWTLAGKSDVTSGGSAPQSAPSAGTIEITGPATATSGDRVTFLVSGTPSLDLAEPLLGQLDWLMGDEGMAVYLQAPGQEMASLEVEASIVFADGGATMRPQVSFSVADAGEYRILVDWNYGQSQLVEHLLIVEGEADPDPPEPEPAALSVLLSYEAEHQTEVDPGQADLLTDPQVRAYLDSHCVVQDGQPAWRFLDLSKDDGSNMPSAWQTVIARARGKATPWLIIDNGNATYEGPCPTNAADLLAKLKQYGGE